MTKKGTRKPDEEIWRRVKSTVRPLSHDFALFHQQFRGEASESPEKSSVAPAKGTASPEDAFPLPHSDTAFDALMSQGIGSRARKTTSKATVEPLARPAQNTPKRIRRGKVQIDGRIDLHDHRYDEAFHALAAYVDHAFSKGYRVILVITGKGGYRRGDDIMERTGIIRESLPKWLAHPVNKSKVSYFEGAHQRHGGAGAFYVFLKKS